MPVNPMITFCRECNSHYWGPCLRHDPARVVDGTAPIRAGEGEV